MKEKGKEKSRTRTRLRGKKRERKHELEKQKAEFENERIQAEERKCKITMEERLTLENFTVEKMKAETQEKLAIMIETGDYYKMKGKINSVRLPRLKLKNVDGKEFKVEGILRHIRIHNPQEH